jgi:hypothetical protein
MTTLTGHFNDELPYDKQSKTAISFRDGVLEYLGSELGIEPADKLFTVYRSPATIANAARLMDKLPLTDEHVSLDEPPTSPVGSVVDATMADLFDDNTSSTVGVRNRIEVTDAISGALETGKRQLSLGYGADLVPHVKWDFEQKEILPHHLAVVQVGRCGPSCAFIDRKPNEGDNMPQGKKEGQKTNTPADNGSKVELTAVFTDAEGAPNMEQIVEVFQQLPEAARKVPIDVLQKFLPQLQELVALAGGANGTDVPESDEGEDMDAGMGEDMTDEGEDMEKKDYTDTAAFKDAIAKAVRDDRERHGRVIDKAKNFVDESYSYHGKSTEQIMRDALATEYADAEIADTELDVAFKLLKRTESNLKNFGDGAADASAGKFDSLKTKER